MPKSVLPILVAVVTLCTRPAAQASESIWEIPQNPDESYGVTVCPSGDGPTLTIRYKSDNSDAETELQLQILFTGVDNWDYCSSVGSEGFLTDGVYEQDGWWRFDVQPQFILAYPSGARIKAIGTYLDDECPTALSFRTFDLDGSGAVDLGDVQAFSVAYYNGYEYNPGADLNWDGIINLSDVSALAAHNGHDCSGTSSAVSFDEIETEIQRALFGNENTRSFTAMKSRF